MATFVTDGSLRFILRSISSSRSGRQTLSVSLSGYSPSESVEPSAPALSLQSPAILSKKSIVFVLCGICGYAIAIFYAFNFQLLPNVKCFPSDRDPQLPRPSEKKNVRILLMCMPNADAGSSKNCALRASATSNCRIDCEIKSAK